MMPQEHDVIRWLAGQLFLKMQAENFKILALGPNRQVVDPVISPDFAIDWQFAAPKES